LSKKALFRAPFFVVPRILSRHISRPRRIADTKGSFALPGSNIACSLSKRFSHVYVEEAARDFPLSGRILSRLPSATKVTVQSYKDVFNRKKQRFDLQKKAPKLILAKKRPPFLYPASELCRLPGRGRAMYTTPVLNCIYDCKYCFLHGMYDSANIVVFVNIEDFFDAARRTARFFSASGDVLKLHISYESDLSALEDLTGFCAKWLQFTRSAPGVEVELRTKSAAYSSLSAEPLCDRFVLAWSLSPPEIVRKYEARTPSLEARLKAAAKAAQDGRPIRFCIDPVIAVPGAKNAYREMIRRIFEVVPARAVKDATTGPFRAAPEHLKRMKKRCVDCDLFWEDTYLENRQLAEEVVSALSAHLGKDKVFLWQSQS
jgi:spore photoproduct lyase